MKVILLITMFFCHIVDDYYLQGCLANMKQKSWWKKQTTNKLYKYDYIMALFEHAFSWTFMVLLPILIYVLLHDDLLNNPWVIVLYVALLVVNCITHAFVDMLKANLLCINLVTDQLIHFIQIIVTWLIVYDLIK